MYERQDEYIFLIFAVQVINLSSNAELSTFVCLESRKERVGRSMTSSTPSAFYPRMNHARVRVAGNSHALSYFARVDLLSC